MATMNANGDVQLEQGDVIPREIAIKDDDSPEIKQLIQTLNQHTYSAKVFGKVLEIVDNLRSDYHNVENPDLSKDNQTPT
jgi:hypothetical protein